MSSVPSEEAQAALVRSLETAPLVPGGTAYLISAPWLTNWRTSVGYSTGAPLRIPVPPIDNEGLFDNIGLRRGLVEGTDFFIVNEGVWKALFEWYGGGPIVSKPIELNPMTGDPEVIVSLPRYIIFCRNEERPIPFSHLKTVGELKSEACTAFCCDPEHSRLVDFDKKERGIVLEDAKTLIAYQFFDQHAMLLEYRRDDGQWISLERLEKKDMPNSPSLQTVFAIPSEAGLCGLTNLGNTCYMNTALQCLAHTDVLVNYFLGSDQWRNERNLENPIGTHCEVVDEFVELLREMWSGDNTRISPRGFKFTIGTYAKQFAGQNQQDGAEFLTLLLDLLHEDLNRIVQKPKVDPVFGNGENDQEVAALAWERHKLRNDSVIVDNFHGQLRSRLICPNCHSKTIVFDPFATLTLPLPVPKAVSPPLIFVPYDINEPRIEMRLTVIQPPTLLEYVDSLSKRIGRKLHSIVFAERAPEKASYLTWKPTLQQGANVCYAYEIPPHSSESVFACVRLTTTRTFDSIDRTEFSTELDGIFLVELPGENATEEEVLEACKKRFEPLWKPTTSEISDELVSFRENLSASSKYVFQEDELMKVLIESRRFDTTTPFLRERNYKFLTSRPVQVMLNPDIIKDETKFDWGILRRLSHDTTPCRAENRQSVSLDATLQMFANDDVLDIDNKWFCPHCREFVCANKKMDIWKLPNVLVLHFKRFMQTASSPMKLETRIEYPPMIDMSKHVIGPNTGDCTYKLYAAMYHSGGIGGGHYVARAFHSKSRRWYLFDDSNVKQVPPAGSHTTDGYVVFYAKCAAKKITRRGEKHPIEITDDMIARMFTPKIHPNVCALDEDPAKSAKKKPRPAKVEPIQPAHVQAQLPMAQQKPQPIPVVRFQQKNPGIPPFFNQFYGANQPEPKHPQQPKK